VKVRRSVFDSIGAGIIAAATVIMLAGCSVTVDAGPMGGMNHGNGSDSNSRTTEADRAMPDVAFTMMMIPHHEQAIEMADMVLTKEGMDPGVVDLAGRIKAGQAPEIVVMESWLDEWGVGMDGMNHGSVDGMRGMGGMLSEADMDALDQASAPEANRLFLGQMIEHHLGAIEMAEREISRGRYAPTVDLAERIVIAQEAEIREMEQLLRVL